MKTVQQLVSKQIKLLFYLVIGKIRSIRLYVCVFVLHTFIRIDIRWSFGRGRGHSVCMTGAEYGNELPHMHYKTTSHACLKQFKGTRKRLSAQQRTWKITSTLHRQLVFLRKKLLLIWSFEQYCPFCASC